MHFEAITFNTVEGQLNVMKRKPGAISTVIYGATRVGRLTLKLKINKVDLWKPLICSGGTSTPLEVSKRVK